MSKTIFKVSLVGMIRSGNAWAPAKTHQADEVVFFCGQTDKGTEIQIDHRIEGTPVLITGKGKYQLIWNHAGFFEPATPIPGVKVHVTLKKITGKVIYWA